MHRKQNGGSELAGTMETEALVMDVAAISCAGKLHESSGLDRSQTKCRPRHQQPQLRIRDDDNHRLGERTRTCSCPSAFCLAFADGVCRPAGPHTQIIRNMEARHGKEGVMSCTPELNRKDQVWESTQEPASRDRADERAGAAYTTARGWAATASAGLRCRRRWFDGRFGLGR